ncbi:MAG: hypothetical protein ACAI44_03680, partial [Candidatus Sericytochromatia bacterium]
LEKYALPQLKAMGFELETENKDGRIYLRPKQLQLNNLPLSAQAVGDGQLNLQLAGHTRFSVDANGLNARLDNVPANGSSNVRGAERSPAAGEAPDSIKGHFKAGLNYDPRANRLDTQVVLTGGEAELHLDREELAKVPFLPADARKLAGDTVDGKLRLQGSYRTVNGSEHEGSLQGQVEITNKQGDETTDVFSRFRTKASQRDPNLAVNLSAVDVRHTKPGQEIRVRAESGKASTGAKGPDLSLQRVKAQAKLGKDQLAKIRKMLDEQHLGSAQLKAALQAVGITPAQLKILTEGNDEQIGKLLSSSQLAKKIQQAMVSVEAESAQVSQGAKSVEVKGQGLRFEGEAGDGKQTKVSFHGQASQATGEVTVKNDTIGDVQVQAQQAEVRTEIRSQGPEGSVEASTRLQATEVQLGTQGEDISLAAHGGTGSGEARVRTARGGSFDLSAQLDGLETSRKDGKLDVSAESASGRASLGTAGGSHVSAEAAVKRLSFSQQGEGQWVLSAPEASSKASLEVQVGQLRKLVEQLGAEAVARLAKEKNPAKNQTLLERAGLTSDEIQRASELLARPEIKGLLANDDLVKALQAGHTIQVEVSTAGNLTASEAPGQGLQAESKGTVKATGRMRDAQGRTRISGEADLGKTTTRTRDGKISVSSPQVQTRAQGLREDGSTFAETSGHAADLEASLGEQNEVRTGAAGAELIYESSDGTKVDASVQVKSFGFQQQGKGKWVLSIPEHSSRAEVQLQVTELQHLVKKLGSQAVSRLASERSPESLKAALEKAGLPQDKAQKAANLLWRPELRSLLATSEFANALEKGQSIKIEVSSQGNVEMSGSAGQGVHLDAKGKVDASASLDDAQGQSLLSGKLAADEVRTRVDKGELSISSPETEVVLEGHRSDGSVFAVLNGKVEDLKARLGAKRSELTAGPANVELSAQTTLDAEKIKEVQNLLTDFKDELVERLRKLGLSREQFEQILNAFGREQLEALLKSFKPGSIANLSEDLGMSKEQIDQMLSLLNDQSFQKLVEDFFSLSELLNDSKAQIHLKADAKGGSWSSADDRMLAELRGITSKLEVQTQHEHGSGTLQVEASEDSLRYRHGPDEQRVEWGAYSATASGAIQDHDGQRRSEGKLNMHGGQGQIGRTGDVITSSSEAIALEGQLKQQSRDGSSGTVDGKVGIGGFTSERNVKTPETAHVNVRDIKASAQGEVNDAQAKQHISGSVDAHMGRLDAQPQGMQAQDSGLDARVQSDRDFGKGQTAEGEARLRLGAEQMSSSERDGVQVPLTTFEGSGEARLSRDGKLKSSMKFDGRDGEITDLHAQDGKVTIGHVGAEVGTDLQTPMVHGQMQGQLKIDGVESTPDKTTAQGFALDEINGTFKIKTDRLIKLVSNNKDAKAILETISSRWDQRGAKPGVPNIFTSDELTLQVDKTSWRGDARDGNALKGGSTITGHLRLPDVNTRLARGVIDLELKNISLADTPDARTQVEVAGTVDFKPNQPEFNQSVQSLVETHMKSIGVDLKPQVTFERGEFRVKIDRWFVDGLISVDFEGDKIQIRIDKARLLGFISAKGLASSFAESKLNNYMLDLTRKDETLTLSLSEFSEQLLHKDNLQIQRVETRPDNSIQIKFAYTDTPAYNQAYAQRQQDRLDKMLFRDPRNNKPRSKDQIEDMVEELEPVRLRAIFQQGSPAQLRRILEAVGNDYDDILRKVMENEPNLNRYPVANRAVMAAYLASDKGFLESVDSKEKGHIRRLISSLASGERAVFDRALSPEERARIQKQLKK